MLPAAVDVKLRSVQKKIQRERNTQRRKEMEQRGSEPVLVSFGNVCFTTRPTNIAREKIVKTYIYSHQKNVVQIFTTKNDLNIVFVLKNGMESKVSIYFRPKHFKSKKFHPKV
jgi:hypothetical protein